MTPVIHLESGEPARLTENGRSVKAKHVVLATNAFTSKLGFLRRAVSPIFEYVGITAPLPRSHLAETRLAKENSFQRFPHGGFLSRLDQGQSHPHWRRARRLCLQ